MNSAFTLQVSSDPSSCQTAKSEAEKAATDLFSLEETVIDEAGIAELSQGDPEEVILYYPWEGVDGVQLYRQDFHQLEPPGFLDDSVIEIGLKLFQTRLKEDHPGFAEQIYLFTPFFYPILSKNLDNLEEGYKQVRGWTDADKVDIFQKKYLIVPINRSLHWYLAIISHPEYALHDSTTGLKTSIWTLDPLGFQRPEVVDILSFYLRAEAREKHTVDIPDQNIIGLKALTPTQPNWYDCGPYILIFVKVFMESSEDFLESIAGNKAKNIWKAEEFQVIRRFLQTEIWRLSRQWTAWKK